MKYAIVRSYLESLEMLACGKSWQWNKRQGTETGRQFCRECQDLWHKQNTWSGKSLVTRRKNMRIWGGHGTRITRDDLAKTGVKDWGMIAGMMLRCAGDWTTRVWTGAPCPDIRQTGEQNRNTREREREAVETQRIEKEAPLTLISVYISIISGGGPGHSSTGLWHYTGQTNRTLGGNRAQARYGLHSCTDNPTRRECKIISITAERVADWADCMVTSSKWGWTEKEDKQFHHNDFDLILMRAKPCCPFSLCQKILCSHGNQQPFPWFYSSLVFSPLLSSAAG